MRILVSFQGRIGNTRFITCHDRVPLEHGVDRLKILALFRRAHTTLDFVVKHRVFLRE